MCAAMSTDSPIWSSEQDDALRRVAEWRRENGQQVFSFQGVAGSGKTTVAIEIGKSSPRVAFATVTGKARSRLIEMGAPIECTSTIHRLIYKSTRDKASRRRFIVTKKPKIELASLDLIVVDEASMVSEKLARDLLSYGRPILAVGDPFLLRPTTTIRTRRSWTPRRTSC